ncbi:unnamed protein product [Lota lota]
MFASSLMNIGSRAYRQDHANRINKISFFFNYSVHCRRGGSSTTSVVDHNKQKTMDDLGGPSFMRTLYWLIGKGYLPLSHQMQIEHSKIYGPLWKSTFGPMVLVNVANADMIEQVLRHEGRHPIRTDMPHWRGYRELKNKAYGPLSQNGADWLHIRSVLNPHLLKPVHVSLYANTLNTVVTDFIDRATWLREKKGQGIMVHNLAEELYKFAFEGICSVLFETRMGCLNEVFPEETGKFIVSVGEMFRLSMVVLLFPKFLWPYNPIWKQFVAAWDHIFNVAEKLVQQKIEAIQEKVRLGEPMEGEYLTHLLLSDQMTLEEIHASITELLVAGVDTTSNTMAWALYLLAANPEDQERLYQEVISVCPRGKLPTSDDFAKMPYLKAVIRETLRLYPVVPGNARLTAEKEIMVGGYLFPKKTLFHLCHYAVSYDETVFPEPHAFRPSRWLRTDNAHSRNHPFGSVPFGFGIRACLGRRLAELEMYLLMSRLMQHFEVRPDPSGCTVKSVSRTLLAPAQPINLQFIDRKKLCGTNYPLSIAFIVVNEFCERFSYYGMRAVLTLYFVNYLHWDRDLSTAIYHAFTSLCYFTPVLGALIADSWLGKFKTIIYLSIVYVIGHVVKSVGAIPTVGDTTVHIVLSMVGLILIAFGTGGIKPCVAAFGGDQFEPEHVAETRKFFSIFYMAINAGSVLSMIITPILRGDVTCFGDDCYALAFGVPAVLMIAALVVFISGSGMYKKIPPEGNILMDVCKCIGFAIKQRIRSSKYDAKRKHWLDWAEEKYSKRLIQEIKMVLRVLMLYIPLPMFWALFDQQGSRWTLQATRMNLAFGESFILKPDQMQMLNALLILILVPIFDIIIYPLVGLCRVNITPLRKMACGMLFAAVAFGFATLVEVNVMKSVVEPAGQGECLVQVYNLMDRNVSLSVPGSDLFETPIDSFQDPLEYERLHLGGQSTNLTISVNYFASGNSSTEINCTQLFTEQRAYSLILYPTTSGMQCDLVADNIDKDPGGNAFVRFISTLSENISVHLEDVPIDVEANYIMSPNKNVTRNRYPEVKCDTPSKMCSFLDLGLLDFGASYTFILMKEEGRIVARSLEDVKANNVHIAWQIPQYLLITIGEVMFSVTGLEFSYSQAPANMKSVLQAGWLLTVAFGNVIVLIVAEGAGLEQWAEFVLFAGLLVAVCIIFSVMAYFYTYVDPSQLDKLYQDSVVNGESKEELKMKTDKVTKL